MKDENEFINLLYYTASYIESDASSSNDWRIEIGKLLDFPGIAQYNPLEREPQKTGKPAGEHIKYVSGLKRSGNYNSFLTEMRRIWWGLVKTPKTNMTDVFNDLYVKSHTEGNRYRDLNFWADFEAVIRSDFIVAFMKKDKPTTGTIIEIFLAMLYKRPVYLIIDVSKTETNSTLLMMVLESGGEIFYNVKECANFIIDRYNLKNRG